MVVRLSIFESWVSRSSWMPLVNARLSSSLRKLTSGSTAMERRSPVATATRGSNSVLGPNDTQLAATTAQTANATRPPRIAFRQVKSRTPENGVVCPSGESSLAAQRAKRFCTRLVTRTTGRPMTNSASVKRGNQAGSAKLLPRISTTWMATHDPTT